VDALVVEPRDVADDRELELAAARPCAVGDELGLEGVDEALSGSVVVGIADGSDRAEDIVVAQHLGVVGRRVLAAGIGVCHERDVCSGGPLMQSHPESIEHQVGAHVVGELPADDPAAVGVDHEAEEHQALPASEIREVREPLLIRPGRGEIALDASGLRSAAGSALVVRHGLPRRLAP
jgi:hypothetical protein